MGSASGGGGASTVGSVDDPGYKYSVFELTHNSIKVEAACIVVQDGAFEHRSWVSPITAMDDGAGRIAIGIPDWHKREREMARHITYIVS